MASQITPPRGMRDFLPADKRRRERILGTIREVYTRHGFDEIETPVVEDAARLHSGLGGDNEKLSFAVMKRALDGEALAAAAEAGDPLALSDLGLRFDLTVPLARFVATHRGTLPGVFRSLQMAPVWRAERPQKGRYRQFVQCDIDIIGEPGALAEVELLVASSAALVELGLDNCTIRVNDRRLLTALLVHCGFAEAEHGAALITIDKLDKIGPEGVAAELATLNATAALQLAAALATWAPLLETGIRLDRATVLTSLPGALREDPAVVEIVEGMVEIADAAFAAGASIRLVFDPSLVRGMGYYTGTIFEAAHPESGSSVGGGGRYDGMIGRFLGQDVPACGFSIGFERIVDLAQLPDSGEERAVALLFDKRASVADIAKVKGAVVRSGASRVRVAKKPKNVRGLLASLAEQGFTHAAHVRDEHVDAPETLSFEALQGS
ncbi:MULTISPECIES: histidine--tRNA ligase [unclassified Pseudoclavibacter]|uniref:histidine--tRNA ligase n=1 Tax=unclassified Pseudoclavibacter TaxID=2615177 RepID=UPI0012F3640C|nr:MULTISPECIES: histidine--tRNA ligase [unclassified Pseudoclavibacter]MBF4459854.1 histidine--tRNA ligase [Pseudoclavibacter sp. VKM Ac-2867]VXB47078.1 Histidine--tRNA ligase [Pseudoclavibacter sp. 8L]